MTLSDLNDTKQRVASFATAELLVDYSGAA